MQNKLLDFYQKYFRTIFDIALIAITIYIALFIWSYIYQIAFPVLLAIVIAAIVRPLSKFLHKKGMKKKTSVTTSLVIFIFTFVVIAVLAGALVVTQLMNLYSEIPNYIDFFKNQALDKADFFKEQYDKIPPDMIQKGTEALENLSSTAAGVVTSLLGSLVAILSSVSSFVINFGLALVLAYFLSYELEDWKTFASKKTPKTFKDIYVFLRDNVFSGISKYIVAQFKLISITFSIVLVGLLILGTGNALTIALISAVFDLVPLLGVPVIFIPWIIYAFVVGNTKLGIGLIVVLVVAMLVRQIFEPKIAGEALGVSPFIMLATTLVFMNIFGISAVFLTPLIIILITQLMDKGILKLLIRKPLDEFETDVQNSEEDNEVEKAEVKNDENK